MSKLKIFLLVFLFSSVTSVTAIADCSSPPQAYGDGQAWWAQYKAWCRGCGGTICDAYNSCGASCNLPANAGNGAASAPGSMTLPPLAPGASLNNAIMHGMAQGFLNSINNSMTNQNNAENVAASPKTPEQLAAEAAEDARQEQARQKRAAEIEERKRVKIIHLDQEAFQMMSLLDAPFNQVKPLTTDFKTSSTCTDEQVGDRLVCHVTYCGGAWNGASVCCPSGYPKLTSDCKCYPNNSNFEEMSYSQCQPTSQMAPNTQNKTESNGEGKSQ